MGPEGLEPSHTRFLTDIGAHVTPGVGDRKGPEHHAGPMSGMSRALYQLSYGPEHFEQCYLSSSIAFLGITAPSPSSILGVI